MPNKFLVETALDIGIENLKSRNTDPKKLYDEVKAAISSEPSSEIKALYQRYIDLYEKSVAVAWQQSWKLSEEIKWKNISDLKKAVESGLSGLSPADIEWLNQFALVEYNRQNSSNRDFPDASVLDTLNRWFRLYESRKVQQNTVTPAVAPTQASATPNTPTQAPAAARPTVYPQTDNTVIPAPEHPIAGPTRRIDGRPEPRRYVPDTTTQSHPRNRAAQTDPRRVDVAPVQPEPRIETLSEGMKRLEAAMDNFDKTIRAVSDKSGYVFDTPEEIKKYSESVNAALKPVMSALRSVEGYKLSKGEKAIYDKHIMQISKYFSNDIDGVKNRHYRNYDLAFDLALGLIKDDLKKQKIEFKPRPTQNDVLASLKTHDPKLHEKIITDLRAGYELWHILSNPQIRSQFDKVYETVYGKWEDEMQVLLKRLKDNRPTMSSPEWQVALDQMIAIMGTTEWYEWKARNEDIAWQTAGMVASTIGWVAGFALAPFSGWVTGIAGSALIGWAIATAGMIATKWRAGNDKETWTELGINTLMFGAGWAVAKWANVYMQSWKALARTTGIAVDAVTWVGLGMWADYARAWSLDTKIELASNLRNNLAWALLPIWLGMKWALRVRAEKIQWDMGRAQTLATMGDTAGAQAIIKKNVEPEATTLAADVQKVAPKEGTSIIWSKLSPVEKKLGDMQPGATHTIETPTGVGILAKRPDWKYEIMLEGKPTEWKVLNTPQEVEGYMASNNMKLNDTQDVSHVQPTVNPRKTPEDVTINPSSTRTITDDEFWGFVVSSIPKNAKIDIPLKYGDVYITPKTGWKYEVKVHNKVELFDNINTLKQWIGKLVLSPKDKANFMKSSNVIIVDNHLKWLHNSQVPDTTPAIRIIRESEWKMGLEVQNPSGGWSRKSIDDISEDDMFKVVAHYTQKNPVQIRNQWGKAKTATLDDMMTKGEKAHVEAHWGSKFLEKLKKELMPIKDGSVTFKDVAIGMIPIPWIWKSKYWWLAATWGAAVIEYGDYHANLDWTEQQFDPRTSEGMQNWGGVLAQILLFRYMGFITGTILWTGYRVIPSFAHYFATTTPWAQVPAQSPSSSPSTIPPTVTPPPSAEVERDGAEEQIPA